MVSGSEESETETDGDGGHRTEPIVLIHLLLTHVSPFEDRFLRVNVFQEPREASSTIAVSPRGNHHQTRINQFTQ